MEVRDYAELAASFDAFAKEEESWRRRGRGYHRLVEGIARFHVPPGARVLEIGCGSGDLLAALEPSEGVGVDVSAHMIEAARERHPEPKLSFIHGEGETVELEGQFDYVVLSDLLPYVHDVLGLFANLARHTHPRTRIVINSYSEIWRPAIRLLELLRLKPRKPIGNWIAPQDVVNLLELADFELITKTKRILVPVHAPVLSTVFNGLVANLWPFNKLCLSFWLVARPRPRAAAQAPSVSVICPCRNEEGNIPEIIRRLPSMGRATELIFVEGGSRDGTLAAIEREIAARPDEPISVHVQTGTGKGDAVRLGFSVAKNEILMILDGDLSVRPEELPRFVDALASGRGELVNGSRLVYDLEPGSMQALNMIGNKLFSSLFRAILGQPLKDTLCGTKVLFRSDYERIAAGRGHFGDFDPFGDFDLLFGAGRLGLKIVDMPVRYQPRSYGSTNISRWRHGLLLFRMTGLAFWKFRVAPVE